VRGSEHARPNLKFGCGIFVLLRVFSETKNLIDGVRKHFAPSDRFNVPSRGAPVDGSSSDGCIFAKGKRLYGPAWPAERSAAAHERAGVRR
jgi:hypothetical protein